MNTDFVTEIIEATQGKPRARGPRTIVKMFKPQFARLVLAGTKKQTVRPVPKIVPRRHDRLSLRMWQGQPYRSKQRLLLNTTLDEIKVCHITTEGIYMQPPDGCLLAIAGAKIICLLGEEANRFAIADGFQSWAEMRAWFENEHGLPFDGVVLYWKGETT